MILGPTGEPLPPSRPRMTVRSLSRRSQVILATLAGFVASLALFLTHVNDIRDFFWPPAQRDREEQRDALQTFVAGTAGIFNELESYIQRYPAEYKARLDAGKNTQEADDELVQALYTRLRKSGSVSDSYSAMLAAAAAAARSLRKGIGIACWRT